MNPLLVDCLEGKHGSYIFPFLWLRGEPKERIREEIIAIKESGIWEFCAESRTYENFCRDEWWDDFGYILKTAKELGMRVWLLDDKKFPTGYANGYLEAPEHSHLRKKLIRETQTEVLGPMKQAKIWAEGWLENNEEKILSIIAYRHADDGEGLDGSSAVDLTDRLKDGMVCWNVPDGAWRVCVTILTKRAGQPWDRMLYYIDMLEADSCNAMIEGIYEPHYEHFKEYFGNTFAGFFSDEPGFLNCSDTYGNTTGIMYQRYPWRADLPALIAENSGMSEDAVRLAVPALWEDLGKITCAFRMHYMDVITKLYRDNFSYKLGDWCREHGVMYIGHVIEDMGAHMRMGYGCGHYFRALEGQDMAGIDVVLLQDVPGFADCVRRAPLADGGIADPAFFRYTLPKLASSHAHIQPLKQGRAMCEIFGAFGWAEGLPYMKGLADIMLIRGINRFVPHAFSPKEDDPDCPPHFYNGGKNHQYPLFRHLMEYMGRCSHLLSDGVHRADVALFYNAEGEWTGGKNQIFHSICKQLTTNLIDFDIIPFDVLCDSEVQNGRLLINGEDYGALIISQSEIFPIDRLTCFAHLAEKGLPVIFTDSLPVRSAEGMEISELICQPEAVALNSLSAHLRQKGLCHISAVGEGIRHLRFYHTAQGKEDIYLFSNEGIRGDINAYVSLPHKGDCLIYDPWDNRCYRSFAENGKLHLCLEKGNMIFVFFGCDIPPELPVFTFERDRYPLSLRYQISVRDESDKDFDVVAKDSELFDISSVEGMSRFSGEVRYRTSFIAKDGYTVLDLGEVGETAEVWLNGAYLGVRINAPYKFSMSNHLCEGENELEILVKSNSAHRRRDVFSRFIQIPPTGVLGEVALCKYEKLHIEQ